MIPFIFLILIIAFNAFLLINSILLLFIFVIFNLILKLNNEIILYALIISLFTMSNNIFSTIFQIEKKIIKLGLSQLLSTIISLAVAILLIKFYKYNWQCRIIGILFSIILTNIYFLFLYVKFSKIDYKLVKIGIIKFYQLGIKILPSLIVGWFFINADKYFLSLNDTKDNLGKYSIMVSVSQISELLFNSFSLAIIPNLLSKMNQDNYSKIGLKKYIKYIFYIFIFLTILMIIFLPLFYKFYVRRSFLISNYILIILIFGYTFIAMNSILTTYHLKLMKNTFISKISIYTLIITILPIYFLVTNFFITGAAISFLLINVVQFGFLFYNYKLHINEF